MDNSNIQNLQSDAVSKIFSFIIIDLGDFNRFAKLLMAWITNQTIARIKDVLERLDWDALYQFHNHEIEVTRDQFHGFIGFAVRLRVEQAMFYDSTRHLFLQLNVQHHLQVLSDLSGNHLPSCFCFIFFKAIYRAFHINETAEEMSQFLNQSYLRSRFLELFGLLEDMYYYISERDYLLPIYKFCPNARDPRPIYQLEGHPLGEELWYSLCPKTVEENYYQEGEFYPKCLTMAHMWETDCAHCKLQLILFKILLSSVYND